MLPDQLTQGQFDTVYNLLSLVIASQLFTALYLMVVQPRVLPRPADDGHVRDRLRDRGLPLLPDLQLLHRRVRQRRAGRPGFYSQAIGKSFNEGYRYVDLGAHRAPAAGRACRPDPRQPSRRSSAAADLRGRGHDRARLPRRAQQRRPHPQLLRAALDGPVPLHPLRAVRGADALARPPARRRSATTVSRLRILLFATWGVYPIAYLIPLLGFDSAGAWVGKQAGYSIADILAKALYGLLILKIARLKSFADDPASGSGEPRGGRTGPSTGGRSDTALRSGLSRVDPWPCRRPRQAGGTPRRVGVRLVARAPRDVGDLGATLGEDGRVSGPPPRIPRGAEPTNHVRHGAPARSRASFPFVDSVRSLCCWRRF